MPLVPARYRWVPVFGLLFREYWLLGSGDTLLAGFLEKRRKVDFLGSLNAHCCLSPLLGCVGHGRWRSQHGILCFSGAGKALGGSLQTAVQTAAPSLNNVSDPMAAIETKVRSASGGQDPAALRDAATTAVRAALTGDPAQQAAANDKAAEALAKAQNIPKDEAKAQVDQYQQQYKETVTKTKLQAKQAADTTARRVSQGALFGALSLLLGALAAFFAGRASAVTPTVSLAAPRT